jgi:putative transposase
MARLARVFVPGLPLHVIQRGNNRQRVFFDAEDSRRYLDWLTEAAAAHALAVHAYVLMPNHVHLLVSPRQADSLPRTLQALGARYVRHINRRRARTGTLWEGRYRCCAIETERYFLACSRYIELNPVRAGLAATPGAFRWSSYRCNGEGAADALITPHDTYLALGRTVADRARSYRELVALGLSAEDLAAIRTASHGNWALGSAAFQRRLAKRTGRPVAPRPAGRPRAE